MVTATQDFSSYSSYILSQWPVISGVHSVCILTYFVSTDRVVASKCIGCRVDVGWSAVPSVLRAAEATYMCLTRSKAESAEPVHTDVPAWTGESKCNRHS